MLRVTSTDYSGAAKKLLLQEGYSEQRIDDADRSGRVRPVDGESDAGGGGRVDGQASSAGPLTVREGTGIFDRLDTRSSEQRARAQRAEACEVANGIEETTASGSTGGTGKKIPTDKGWDFEYCWQFEK